MTDVRRFLRQLDPRALLRRLDARGVTLIELMIVLVMIAVGLLALSGVQTASFRDVYATGRRTNALSLAQERMEVARGLGFTRMAPDSGQTDGFDWRADVDTVSTGMSRVTVSVSWSEKGMPFTVTLVDLLSAR